MTERDYMRICGVHMLRHDGRNRDDIYSLMCYYSASRTADADLRRAIAKAEELGKNDIDHGAIPFIRTGESIIRDFIVYNRNIMRKQAERKSPPKRMTKEYKTYKLICSIGYRFDFEQNRFISAEEDVFNQLVYK